MGSQPLKVLIADRDHALRTDLHRQLCDAGYSAQAVASGEDAILLCDMDPPDVLILDRDLTDMDGFEVCERVRRDTGDGDKDLAVIMTAHVSDTMTRAYLGQMVDFAGGDYFLAKPWDIHLLLMLVEQISASGHRPRAREARLFPTRVVWPTKRPSVLVSGEPVR